MSGKKDNRQDLVEQYKNLFNQIKLIELNSDIAELFSKIRAKYSIKSPDAIQLASTLYDNCDIFVTNDDKLSRFEECKVLLLSKF